jgi:para-aminobenzoate synthetase component 1
MLIEELPYYTDSSSYFEKIKHLEWPVFLDSCYQKDKPQSKYARFDIIAANPFIKIRAKSGVTIVSDRQGHHQHKQPSLEVLSDLMDQYPKPSCSFPFVGGAIGYCSYELNLKTAKKNTINTMMMGIYDWAVIVDHFEKKTYIVSMLLDSKTEPFIAKLVAIFNEDKDNLAQEFKIKTSVSDNLSFIDYKSKFDKVMKYINAGDCYQINLSKKFEVDTEGDSWYLYKKFRDINKSPFMAYLLYDDFEILSGSPERFIKSQDGIVTTRPIKGTRVRGSNKELDNKNANELLNSVKDQSENLMIVDLLRNDLSMNCEVGSINVDELFAIESYPNVHHLVSTISGILKKESNNIKLFSDSFPGGSITGAPKIRATEIIDELEEHSRDLYCGSVCYFSFHGSMDSNVAIRSMVHNNQKLYFYSGGGLTAGSNVDEEFQEIEDKVKNIKQAIKFFKEQR